ncbi:hypothetical protein [Ruminiclostridium cellobioparum]|jgi:hypothetical protein|uniref:Integral membrane protein CcmA involved in cell shape determination n=1 Tax=Ruminiclostridium cellobioparum subsp. termitidis CT1112 TaxID=1195236 RepID=S0FJY7_RUMCE|nr:hypothetical protein [Ruminiclostridium cellobioparum]EMS70626.1 hypothetical protein CTER_3632 [Ruminiclostridium cellobioparum subsp. termitidis CT1112]
MKKTIKLVLVLLIFTLLIPGVVLAARNDLTISNLIILEDKNIDDVSCGNVTVVLGSTDIKSNVLGSVIVVFGKANISGKVNGDVVSAFGEVYLKGDTEVMGNLVSLGKLEKDSDVKIRGTKVSMNFDFISMFKSNGILINALIAGSVFTLVAGLILITIFAARFRVMSYSLNNALPRRMVLGALVVVSLTIVLAFLIFLLVAPVLYLLFILLADIIGSIYLGTVIFKNNYDRSAIYIEFFVGHILISIIKIVPLIFIPSGSYTALMIYGICYVVVQLSLSSFGIGTVIDTGFGKNTELLRKSGKV